MKAGDNLTILEQTETDWILVNDQGTKYFLPIDSGSRSKHAEIASVICDIGEEDDEYAHTVLPLIERILADNYSQTGLFAEIDQSLSLVENGGLCGQPFPGLVRCRLARGHLGDHDDQYRTVCGAEYSPEAKCGLLAGHANAHEATVEDRDPETRLLLGTRTIQFPDP